MNNEPTKQQKIEAHLERIKREMETLTLQHQNSMACILTLIREIYKENEK